MGWVWPRHGHYRYSGLSHEQHRRRHRSWIQRQCDDASGDRRFRKRSESDIAAAIVYAADSGAVVCNISLEAGILYDGGELRLGEGHAVVAAAGNDGIPNSPNYPGALNRTGGIGHHLCRRTCKLLKPWSLRGYCGGRRRY